MITHSAAVLIVATLGVGVAGRVMAQTPPPSDMWTHGTTLNVFAGVGTASSDTGPLAGGAFGWEINPRLSVEAIGTWLDRGDGAGAFAADLKALVTLAPGHTAMPFLHGGVGMYRAWFDLSRGTPPDFYADRIATGGVGLATVTFTDPSFVFGGGLNIFVSNHFAIRPDVDWKVARDDSESYVVTTFNVHVAYHFEDHRITSSRRGSRR